ncbi:MAG: type IV secretion system protein, partial [Dehalococcoidia bacterium]|nr:type IV secretion system protein [Dehalococcoidia bacterium]
MELLPRLLIAALAANLSLDIVRVLVELNNAVAAAVGDAGLPGYDQATSTQAGMATVMVAVTYGVVSLLLAFQMLMRLALICVLAVLGPAMVVCWVLPQTQGWARWWAHLLPITVLQQCVQVLVLKLGSSLMVELAPGDAANAVLTLLLGIAVCYLTLRVPSLLSSQARHAGLSSVVSLVVLSRFAGGLGARGAAVAGAGAR